MKLSSKKIFRKFAETKELWPFSLLVLIIIFFNFINSAFLSPMNISNFFAYFPELAIMALGMTFLLISGEFDLSIGSFFGFCPVLLFTLYNRLSIPIFLAFIIAMIVSGLIGYLNGILVTKVKISSFLTTIGMMLVVRGTALYISHGFPQSSWEADSPLRHVLAGSFRMGDFKLFASLFWFIAIFVVMFWVLKMTRFGNWIFATGGSTRSAEARGVNTDRVKIILFILSALLASLAGTIDAFRISSASPIAGNGYELEVIAMVVIGGTSLYGGKGTIVGTVIGAILLRAMRNGIIVMGVPGLAYNVFVGAIILIMMSIHSIMERNSRGDRL